MSVCVCWPHCKPEGPLFPAEFLCLSVCLWPALLPFNVGRFWWNLVTRTLLWSSLAATIMVQIGRRGTARRLFENFENSQKPQNSNFKILVHHFLRPCLLCLVKKSSRSLSHLLMSSCFYNIHMSHRRKKWWTRILKFEFCDFWDFLKFSKRRRAVPLRPI